MSIIDIILLLLLILGAYLGYQKGLLMELVNTGSLILGVIIGLKYWEKGAVLVQKQFENIPNFLHIIGFIIVFIAVLLLVRLIGKIVKLTLNKSFLGTLDNLLGALLGILKWVLCVGSFLYAIMKYPILEINILIQKSFVCNILVKIIPKVLLLW